MELGLSVAPVRAADVVAAARAADAAGVRSFWLYDVPRTWMDPYPLLTLAAQATERVHLGLCVTNPVIRSVPMTALLTATLQHLSGGRAELGIGRGDASVRAMGLVPASLGELRAGIERFRTEVASVDRSWRSDRPIPVWVGTYGPRGLRLAGAVADGVILQFADVALVRWAVERVGEGAREAGRDPSSVRIMVAGPMAVDLETEVARLRTRWFARMIAPDISAIVRANADALPDLVDWAEAWHAADVDVRPSVADTVSERLALVGTRDGCRERLAALAALGVEEMNVFTMGDEIAAVEAIRRVRS